jgi:hypothetical protein
MGESIPEEEGLSDANWCAAARRKVLIDNHLDDWLPGYEHYDSHNIADHIIAANFECGMIYARCHVGTCYWNASTGPKHAGLGDHDQIRRDLRGPSGGRQAFHPLLLHDLRQEAVRRPSRLAHHRRRAGRQHVWQDQSLQAGMPQSPYRAYMVPALEEIAQNYPIEGAFLDMTFWPAVCYCHSEPCSIAVDTISSALVIIDPTWLTRESSRRRRRSSRWASACAL